ncbi:MAG: hypothetical protein H6839_13435 [Planctomycetes bacterium]|nr:hypothetical protein [Planctomycetota bacterium]
MTHSIQAVVARQPAIEELAGCFKHGHCIAAPQGFAILPLSISKLEDELRALGGTSRLEVPAEFFAGLIVAVEGLSHAAPFVILQTEYFGGAGGQGAGVISAGEWTIPWTWSNTDDPAPEVWPIDRALAEIGVVRSADDDEFDSLQLGRYRMFRGFD